MLLNFWICTVPLYRSFNEFEKKIMNHKCGPVKVLGPRKWIWNSVRYRLAYRQCHVSSRVFHYSMLRREQNGGNCRVYSPPRLISQPHLCHNKMLIELHSRPTCTYNRSTLPPWLLSIFSIYRTNRMLYYTLFSL